MFPANLPCPCVGMTSCSMDIGTTAIEIERHRLHRRRSGSILSAGMPQRPRAITEAVGDLLSTEAAAAGWAR
jgi:hypothetical protein